MHNDRLTSLKQRFVNKENVFVKNFIMSDEEEPINKKRLTAFSSRSLEVPNFASWLKKKDEYTGLCKFCLVDITIKYEGVRGLKKYSRTKRHQNILKTNQISGSVSKFYRES